MRKSLVLLLLSLKSVSWAQTNTNFYDVRALMKLTNKEDLIKKYGPKNVVYKLDDLEGETLRQGYYLYQGTDKEIVVDFDNRCIKLFRKSNIWKHILFNLKVGQPIDSIIKANGKDFAINACFECDNDGGWIIDWNTGMLAKSGISVKLSAKNFRSMYYDLFAKEGRFRSDDSLAKDLDLYISTIVITNNIDEEIENEIVPKTMPFASDNGDVTTTIITNHSLPFNYIENMPVPSYQIDSFFKKNIQYPEFAKNNHVEGRVTVQVVINEDGSISDAVVIKGLAYGCDEEALRLVKIMPKWNAGKQNGKEVKVLHSIVVNFRLDNY